jgi:hypothetical protein
MVLGAGQLFTIITDGEAQKFLKPGPGRAVTAEASEFLKLFGRRPTQTCAYKGSFFLSLCDRKKGEYRKTGNN